MTAAPPPVRGQPGAPYTADEDAIIRALYRRLPASQIAAGLGRTPAAVISRARALGLTRRRPPATLPAPSSLADVVGRVLRLLDLMADGRAWEMRELCRRLDDCPNTAVYRALAVLKALGYPVEQDERRRWRFGGGGDGD